MSENKGYLGMIVVTTVTLTDDDLMMLGATAEWNQAKRDKNHGDLNAPTSEALEKVNSVYNYLMSNNRITREDMDTILAFFSRLQAWFSFMTH